MGKKKKNHKESVGKIKGRGADLPQSPEKALCTCPAGKLDQERRSGSGSLASKVKREKIKQNGERRTLEL